LAAKRLKAPVLKRVESYLATLVANSGAVQSSNRTLNSVAAELSSIIGGEITNRQPLSPFRRWYKNRQAA
jgi:hypothetical protein